MVTVFIINVGKLGSGDVIFKTKIVKGVLKDTMKLAVEGKVVSIARMGTQSIQAGKGPDGASVMHPNWVKEVQEGQPVQMMVTGADFQTLKKCERKNVEFQ